MCLRQSVAQASSLRGRSGILPGQGGEETGKMPVGPTAKMAVLQGRARRSSPPRGILGVTNSLERRRHD